MEIVRETIERLKGRIEVYSAQGTTFTITLPLSLSVVRALLVAHHDKLYAIPLQSVVRVLKISSDQIESREGKSIIRDGKATHPFMEFADYLGSNTDLEHHSSIVVVLESAHGTTALGVERVLPGRDIVVKSVGEHISGMPGILGATILGDGNVVPILDANYLIEEESGERGGVSLTWDASDSDDPLTAMIVDDSASVRRVMKKLVEHAGWTPLIASNGQQALELLRVVGKLPDIFLLDIEMPHMDGFELLAHLRQQLSFRETPIVMISSRTGEKHRQKAAELGATEFVAKPFQHDELVKVIRRLAGQRAMESVRL